MTGTAIPFDEKKASDLGKVGLMDARQKFRTKLTPSSYKPNGPAPAPSGAFFKVVRYPSPVGELVAYLTPDPGDGKRHPAVVWAHGGFGGIGAGMERDTRVFSEAGLIVLCPSWRGENDNPGLFELFYGEVDDAVAAVEYLSSLPYVDASRVYMVGHSTGGTITLLTAEATKKLRAAFSFGGAPDLEGVVLDGKGGYGNTPFDPSVKEECHLRSPTHFVGSLSTPTFYFEGASSSYVRDAQWMERAAIEAKAPFRAFIVKGGTHFNILQPLCAMAAKKMVEDSGKAWSIDIDAEEVKEAFAKRAKK